MLVELSIYIIWKDGEYNKQEGIEGVEFGEQAYIKVGIRIVQARNDAWLEVAYGIELKWTFQAKRVSEMGLVSTFT